MALTKLGAYESLPPYLPMGLLELDIGRAYFLGGREEAALPWLERAAASCHAMVPFSYNRAHYWLGRAREARGDAKGACESYRTLLRRWGNAKPRSVTAEAVRKRLTGLDCKAPK